MDTINVRLSENQLKELDSQVDRFHYSSRSEFVREALRKMMEDYTDLSSETVKAIAQARKQKSVSHGDVKRKLGL